MITCKATELNKAISELSKINHGRISYLRWESEDGKLVLLTADQYHAYIAKITTAIDNDQQVTLPWNKGLVAKYLGLLGDATIKVDLQANYTEISASGNLARLSNTVTELGQYPDLSKAQAVISIAPGYTFHLQACQSIQEIKGSPVSQVVFFKLNQDILTMVSTDGYRMFYSQIPVVVSGKPAAGNPILMFSVSRSYLLMNGETTFYLLPNVTVVSANNLEAICETSSILFPEVERYLLTSYISHAQLPLRSLKQVIDTFYSSTEAKRATVRFSQEGVFFSSTTIDVIVKAGIPVLKLDNEFETIFNPRLIKPMLDLITRKLNPDTITWAFNTNNGSQELAIENSDWRFIFMGLADTDPVSREEPANSEPED